MVNTILLPVDIHPKEFHLADYAHFFAHMQGKRFSTFFLTDVTHPKGSKVPLQVELNKTDLQQEIFQDAEKLRLDVSFLTGPANLQLLTYQSRFADLIMVSPLNKDSLKFLLQANAVDFLKNVGCPLLLAADPHDPFEEIVFLFDYDLSGLDAMKSFMDLFGKTAVNKKLTVITVSPDDESGVSFEKCLIDYLQKSFSNVGILPMARAELSKKLVKFACQENRPLLIMGKKAVELLKDKELSSEIVSHQISLFYSNQ